MIPELRTHLGKHQAAVATELQEMAALLNAEGLAADLGPLYNAAAECRRPPRPAPAGSPGEGRLVWGYEVTDLRLNIEPQKHWRPRAAKLENATGCLTVRVEEYAPETLDDVGRGLALVRTLQTDFVLDAILDVDGEPHCIRSAWHVDTHAYPMTPGQSAHPRFHFQHGGKQFETIDETIRGVFLPEAPRMPCAPLDGPLAIDFILSHYCGKAWERLRYQGRDYGELRWAPMTRYWKPYFQQITSTLDELADRNRPTPNDLLPNVY